MVMTVFSLLSVLRENIAIICLKDNFFFTCPAALVCLMMPAIETTEPLGVVDYLHVLAEATTFYQLLEAKHRAGESMPSVELQRLREATREMLRLLRCYQLSLHGRSTRMVLTVNKAFAQLLHDSCGCLLPSLQEDEPTPPHVAAVRAGSSPRGLLQSLFLKAFKTKKLLQRAELPPQAVEEWFEVILNSLAVLHNHSLVGVADPLVIQSMFEKDGFNADTWRTRAVAFDVAVPAFCIANKMTTISELFVSLKHAVAPTSPISDEEGTTAAATENIIPAIASLGDSIRSWRALSSTVLNELSSFVGGVLCASGDLRDAEAWLRQCIALEKDISGGDVGTPGSAGSGAGLLVDIVFWIRCTDKAAMLCVTLEMLALMVARCESQGTEGVASRALNPMDVALHWATIATHQLLSNLVCEQIRKESDDVMQQSPLATSDSREKLAIVSSVIATSIVDELQHVVSNLIPDEDPDDPAAAAAVSSSVVYNALLQFAKTEASNFPQAMSASALFDEALRSLVAFSSTTPASDFQHAGGTPPASPQFGATGAPTTPSSYFSTPMEGASTPQLHRGSKRRGLQQKVQRELDPLFLLLPPVCDDCDFVMFQRVASPLRSGGAVSPRQELEKVSALADKANIATLFNALSFPLRITSSDPTTVLRLDALLDVVAEGEGLVDVLTHSLEDVELLVNVFANQEKSSSGPPNGEQKVAAATLPDACEVASDGDDNDASEKPTDEAPHMERRASTRFSRGLLRHWSAVGASQNAIKKRRHEPLAFFVEMDRLTVEGQSLICRTIPSLGGDQEFQQMRATAVAIHRLVVTEFHPLHHGKAPATLLALSTLCATAAQLFRKCRRHVAHHGAPKELLTLPPAKGRLSSDPTLHKELVVCETEMWNRTTVFQKCLLAVSHLEPVSRVMIFMERGSRSFDQGMWLTAANEFAVAERILVARRESIVLGLRHLKAASKDEEVRDIQESFRSVLPIFLTSKESSHGKGKAHHRTNKGHHSRHNAHPQPGSHHEDPIHEAAHLTPTSSVRANQQMFLVDRLLVKIKYNIAASLWCAGHTESAAEWIHSCAAMLASQEAAEATKVPDQEQTTSPLSPSQPFEEVVEGCVKQVATLVEVMRADLLDLERIAGVIGVLSSYVSSHADMVAGALVLVQCTVERYVSINACNAMTEAVILKREHTTSRPPPTLQGHDDVTSLLLPLNAQANFIASTCSEVVRSLSGGKLGDVQTILRDGLPSQLARWDKMLLHAIVTCMNFCTAFPDSVWYEAAFQQHTRDVKVRLERSVAAGRSPESISSGSSVVGKLASTFRSIFSGSFGASPPVPETAPAVTSTQPVASVVAARHPLEALLYTSEIAPPCRAFEHSSNHVGLRNSPSREDVEFGSTNLLHETTRFENYPMCSLCSILRWVLEPPLVAVREEDVRLVSIILDECFLALQNTIHRSLSHAESERYEQELRKRAEAATTASLDWENDDDEDHLDRVESLRRGRMRYLRSSATNDSIRCDAEGALPPKPACSRSLAFCALSSEDLNAFETPVGVSSAATIPGEGKREEDDSYETPVDAFASTFVPPVTLDKVPGSPTWSRVAVTPTLANASRAATSFAAGNLATDLSTPSFSLLSITQRTLLHDALPLQFQLMPWRTIYSTRHHGTSYRTMLSNADGENPVILCLEVVSPKSTASVILGALIPNGIRLGNQKYYGGGETFIFRFVGGESAGSTTPIVDTPTTTPMSTATRLRAANGKKIEVFRWAHDNEYFVNCRMDHLAIGGGRLGAAVYIEENLQNGSTSRCQTFQSPPLVVGTSDTADCENDQAIHFDIVAIDLYAVGGTQQATSLAALASGSTRSKK